ETWYWGSVRVPSMSTARTQIGEVTTIDCKPFSLRRAGLINGVLQNRNMKRRRGIGSFGRGMGEWRSHKMRTRSAVLLVALLLTVPGSVLSSQTAEKKTQVSSPPTYTFKVVNVFPHDSSAYTQGLVYHGGFLYEGTGLNGRSSLRKVRLETGQVVQQVDLVCEYFGEGIAILKNTIVQLTWRSQAGFVYNLGDFHLLKQFSYTGEGWGLTSNGNELFMSDGTAEIRVLDGSTFKEKRRLRVHDGDKA